jgi:hypothetical protein
MPGLVHVVNVTPLSGQLNRKDFTFTSRIGGTLFWQLVVSKTCHGYIFIKYSALCKKATIVAWGEHASALLAYRQSIY